MILGANKYLVMHVLFRENLQDFLKHLNKGKIMVCGSEFIAHSPSSKVGSFFKVFRNFEASRSEVFLLY